LEKILRLETERVLSNDGVVRDENRFYEVGTAEPPSRAGEEQGEGVRMGRREARD
jgi:hypothetical protein